MEDEDDFETYYKCRTKKRTCKNKFRYIKRRSFAFGGTVPSGALLETTTDDALLETTTGDYLTET